MFLAPLLPALPGHGIDLSAMDRSVRVESPADLFRFANGRWIEKTPLPADKSYVGTFDDIYEHNLVILKRICERQATAHRPFSTVGGKVGLLYRLSMDTARADRLGASPLRPELARIDAVTDARGLMREIAHLEPIGASPGFGAGVYADDKDTSRLLYTLGQPASILGDRDLYLGTDARAKAARAQYLKTFGGCLRLAGLPEAGATQALALETALARVSSTPVELRDPATNYHRISLSALKAMSPHTPWDAYFGEVGVRPAQVNVMQPKALGGFDALVASRPMAEWRSLLRSTLFKTYALDLSGAYYDQGFALQRALTGQRSPEPRWKQSIRKVDALVGEALGQLYVREASPRRRRLRRRRWSTTCSWPCTPASGSWTG